MTSPKTFRLNNGTTIPAIGFGTFANEGAKGETYRAVTHALQTGYRHLDCAWFYQNEDEVGDAVADFLAKTPDVSRADLFLCTKVWNHLHAPEDVRWSLESSLKKLRTEYVDLFLVHWPIAAERGDDYMPKRNAQNQYITNDALTQDHRPTWRAVEQLYSEGLAKAIGVSNWTEPLLRDLLSWATIPPAVNQIEIHPFLPNEKLVAFCLAHDILPEAYSPLGSQNQVPTTGEKVSTNAALQRIAAQGGHTLAQVLIAWGLRRGYVVLPKSSTPARIESNFQAVELSEEEFAAVNEVAEGRHTRFVDMKGEFGYDLFQEGN